MERVAKSLQKLAGLATKSLEITQGTAPVRSNNSPGPRNEVPDRFGEGQQFVSFLKLQFLVDIL